MLYKADFNMRNLIGEGNGEQVPMAQELSKALAKQTGNGLALSSWASTLITTALVEASGISEYAGEALQWIKGEITGRLAEGSTVAHPTFEPDPYAGESIPARSAGRDFTPGERVDVNRIGSDTGCHSCGSLDPGTKSGNFVPDHQPVTSLNTEGVSQRLYPQCISCSRAQGLAAARELRTLKGPQ